MKKSNIKSDTKRQRINQFNKSISGITLIALVVTIVVLLILAGVSISMLTGENGILKMAEKAKEETEKTGELEKVQLAVMTTLMYNSEITAQNLKDNIERELNTNNELIQVDDKSYVYKGIYDNYLILSTGNVSVTGNASDIKDSDYGKRVNYNMSYTANIDSSIHNEWEILYADNENVYLISYYTVSDPIYNSCNLINSVYLPEYNEGTNLIQNTQKYPAIQKWLKKYLKTNINGTLNNFKMTLFMLDSEKWSCYKNDYASYAIGSPTIEMMVKSLYGKNYEISDEYVDSIGYNANSLIPSGLTTTKNNGVYNHREYYWIASPSCRNQSNMIRFLYNYGSLDNGDNGFNAYNYGFRPVICLNSKCILKWNDSAFNILYK